MTEAAAICLRQEGAIATLVIANAARRNALSQAMWAQLQAEVAVIAANESIKVVIVRGDGDAAFSAGADISEFTEIASDPARLQANNELVQAAQAALHNLNKPTIALVHGACVGGGCGLALCCDFRFASPDARFAITPAKLGLLYSKADTRRLLNQVGPALTRELLFTGRMMDAQEAAAVGLVNGVLEADQLDTHVQQLAEQLAAGSQYSLRGIKQVLASLEGHGGASDAELQTLFDDAFTGEDCREGVAAFMAKRAPKFPFR